MTIDWTKPVETTEDPPRPVRVLCTDNRGMWPVVVSVDGTVYGYGRGGDTSEITAPHIRNVAPPKPEPVMLEGFVAIVDSYQGAEHDFGKVASGPICKDGTALAACHPNLIIGRLAWMSDGSPVPGEAADLADTLALKLNKMIADRDQWLTECVQWAEKASDWAIEKDALTASLEEARQQRDDASVAVEYWIKSEDEWRTKAEALQAEVERMKPFNRDVEVLCHQHGLEMVRLQVELGKLKDEAESMKPVVDAAVAWVLPELRGSYSGDTQRLIEAVRTYQQSPKKTAAEAVANVAEMMGPVKNCRTCRFGETKAAYDGCAFIRSITIECDRNGFSKWEAKSHD